MDNEAFAQNSWYFRNALVRANYVNYSKNVTATPVFLERFFDNLLFGANYQLRNREMQISMGFVKTNPKATQDQIAEHIGKSTRTVKRITASLYEKGYLVRENGKRNGNWKIIEK